MALRTPRVVGMVLSGLVAGASLIGVVRVVAAGPGEPPVIVLPSAHAAMKQAPPPDATKVELLPPPASARVASAPLKAPIEPLQLNVPAPMFSPKEVAPSPRVEAAATTPSTGAEPAPNGESTMNLRKTAAAAAAVAGLMAPANVQAEAPKQVVEKITDYAKADDVKALKTEIESLRKQLDGVSSTADVKALKDEVAALKKEIATLNAAKSTDTAKATKDEVDALRKDVQALNLFLRETLVDGKVEKGFTHDAIVKRLQKLDEALDALTKKVAAGEHRVTGSSPIAGSPPIAGAKGTVKVVNEYPIEISIVVNGLAYRLDPGTRKEIPVSAGSFKYQLLTSGGGETERAIKESETVTLTIR